MRVLQLQMKLDDRVWDVSFNIKKGADIIIYEEVLNAMSQAMLRVIKKEYFDFSREELVLDCLKKEKA